MATVYELILELLNYPSDTKIYGRLNGPNIVISCYTNEKIVIEYDNKK